MVLFKALAVSVLILCFTSSCISKIVLPHKLRYLENMLNSEVVAKAAKMRQQMEANPNAMEGEKSWPMMLANHGPEDKKQQPTAAFGFGNFYGRRMHNFK